MNNDILNSTLYQAFAEASEYVYVYALNMNTGVSRWAKNAVDYFDLPGEYMQNAEAIWLEHIHPDDREAYLEDIIPVVEGKGSRHCCQYRAKNRFGKYVWLECRGSVKKGENGEHIFAGIMTRLDCQSAYDQLTGLKNKNQFYGMELDDKIGAMAMVDVDYFKKFIKTYGYDKGDTLLVELGKIFAELVGNDKHVFRFSNDEFLFVLPGAGAAEMKDFFREITVRAGHIDVGLENKVKIDFSASAIIYPMGDDTRDDMIYKLLMVLDKVKKNHRGSILFYSQDLFEKERRISKIKKELRESIEDGFRGFELYYQPWMDKDGKKIVGCEALLRWKGKEIKDSYPGEFIPILEETNDILEVGRFVMREAMKRQREWSEKYGKFIVSFNVSYEQFLEPDYVKTVADTAKEFGVDPSRMVIELTESCSVQAPETLANVFAELKELGFHIALDDFGTGYASLEMLKLLPADSVKIEHTFVRELSLDGHAVDFAIIKSIIYLCRELGQKVVVEGIETAEVESIIREMDVGFLQGYYYSKPICKDDFEALLDKQ
ncbi:MAG: EAL domain-containing protein [Acetatifactor sp.]|nr:EAL domain-containing protein [Acetatifactor sp.]